MQADNPQKQKLQDKHKKQKWIQEQKYIKSKIIQHDDFPWKVQNLRYIAGVDISFSGKFQNGACSALIIWDCIDQKIVYQKYQYVILKQPYIPGFLAFRQLPPTLKLFELLKKQKPQFWPQLIMVDGNGIVHKFNCGYASHLGVILNIPTIGCAKTFFDIDGLHQNEIEEMLGKNLQYELQYMKIIGKSGKQWCTAILSDQKQNKHIYISIGTKISLNTATNIVLKYLIKQIPEPVRLADANSRKMIKKMQQNHYKNAPSYEMIYLVK